MLCNAEGCPIAIEVFSGNTADPNTLGVQIQKLRQRFALKRVVLVGDRGMITSRRINEELRDIEGLDWITALQSEGVRKLAFGLAECATNTRCPSISSWRSRRIVSVIDVSRIRSRSLGGQFTPSPEVPELGGFDDGPAVPQRMVAVDEANRIIEAAEERPFFLYVAHHSPHYPLNEPPKSLSESSE